MIYKFYLESPVISYVEALHFQIVEGRFNLGIGYLKSDLELFEALINQWNQHPLL